MKFSEEFQKQLGHMMANCWHHFGAYGFSLEFFMDEILDGGFGYDIAIRQTTQGVLYTTPCKEFFWERLANIHQDSTGSILIQYSDFHKIKEKLHDHLQSQRITTHDTFTKRELLIGDLLALGCTNKQIANNLNLSEKTVKNYISRLLDKTHTANRTALALHFQSHRLIPTQKPAETNTKHE